MEQGIKLDKGKLRFDLLDQNFLDGLAAVLTFGAEKYSANSWQNIENAEERYYAALQRHLSAYRKGEQKDSESGINHLYHAAANIMFLAYFEQHKKTEKTSLNDLTRIKVLTTDIVLKDLYGCKIVPIIKISTKEIKDE